MTPFSNFNAPQIERELEAGERILWTGRPNPARWKGKAFRMWPVAFFISAFIAFWMWSGTGPLRSELASGKTPSVPSLAFPALALITHGFIVKMWLGPWLEAARARRTFYALTDRRALIVTEGRKTSVQSVSVAQIQLERRDISDFEGDLILMPWSNSDDESDDIGFFAIPNPREVERIIRQNLKT